MKLTVLGFWGAYPEKQEATAGYLLQTKELNLLIDCGSGVLAQLFRYIPIEKLDAVILSHYHHDHVADLGCLQYATMISNRLGKKETGEPLPIYGHTQSKFYSKLTYKGFTVGRGIKHGGSINLKGLKVDFLPTVHEEYNLAMKFECDGKRFVYTGDTGNTKALIPFLKGSDLVLTETSLYANQSGQMKGHLTSKEAGQLAESAGVKQLLLTHFPHYGDIMTLESEVRGVFEGKVEMSVTGKVIEID
jgi:ribonuclease BN (tRNA processing enzyme)